MPDGLVRRGSHLVRPPRAEELAFPERHAHVRPEELVRRADEDIHVPRGHVDRPVRRVVDGVRPGERAGVVRELHEASHVGSGADGVGGDGEGDDARPLGEEPFDVVVVDLELVGEPGDADDDAEVVGELEPGRDVRVVVERSDDDLVAPLAASAPSARVRRKLSAVMLGPKAISSGEQPRNDAAFSCARSTSTSVRRDVS